MNHVAGRPPDIACCPSPNDLIQGYIKAFLPLDGVLVIQFTIEDQPAFVEQIFSTEKTLKEFGYYFDADILSGPTFLMGCKDANEAYAIVEAMPRGTPYCQAWKNGALIHENG
jgi:hypothetical protein